MTTCELSQLKDVIARHGGVLRKGSHEGHYDRADCPVCLNEAIAFCRLERGELQEITDNPETLGLPNWRPLNDGPWSSDELRTEHMLRLYEAYSDWSDWSDDRRADVIARVCVLTVNRIIADLWDLPNTIRDQCRQARNLMEAKEAAEASEKFRWAGMTARGWAARAASGRAALAASVWEAWASMEAGAKAAAAAMWAMAAGAKAAETASDASSADAVLIATVDLWIEAAA